MAVDRYLCSSKPKKHATNVQVLADPFGRLLRASPTLRSTVHDALTAREQHGIVNVPASWEPVRRSREQVGGMGAWHEGVYRQGLYGEGGRSYPVRGKWLQVARKLRCVSLQ